MSELFKWLPWILVALIPGLLNLLVAFKQLADDCKFLPFFEPEKTPGVWIWAIAQLAFPSVLFWLTDSFYLQPEINFSLIGRTIGFGLGFITIMNARTETGFFTLDIKTFYTRIVRLAYDLIAAQETARTAGFWVDVEQELLKKITDFTDGLNFLENYFKRDVSLSPEQIEDRQRKLEEARIKPLKSEQVKAIVALMDVRRMDLPSLLHRFGFSDEFMKKYFKQK